MLPSHETVCCGLAAFAAVRLSFAEIASLRKQPPTVLGAPLPGNLLRHADEQTVAALAALATALATAGLTGPFTDWAAVAGPRFAGRTMVAWQVPRFSKEGPWGVSPHVIPHHSLHCVSGTLSQALKAHGPNCGVGGGPSAAAEALLTALALLAGDEAPGVWLASTRLAPEGPLDRAGAPIGDCWAEASVLALVPPGSALARQAVGWPDLLGLLPPREGA